MADIRDFKCPACGGSLKFDSDSQNVTCPYCDAIYSKQDLIELDEDINEKYDEQIVWDEVDQAMYSEEEAKGMSVYHCDSCGGEVICGENTSATSCPYCGNAILIKSKISGELKPKIIIPFKIEKEQASESFKKYFSSKFFIPSRFKKECQIKESDSMYVPYWLFSADVDGTVRFNGEVVRRWSDSNYDYKEVKYYRLYRYGLIAFDDIPVDASAKMPNDLMESIEPFDIRDHKEFLSGYLAGYKAEKYDVSKEENQKRANVRIKEGTVDALRKTVTGYSNVTVYDSKILLSNQLCNYALYPIWMLTVNWEENNYIFAVNGDTGKVAGKYPISKLKVALVVALITIACLALFSLIGIAILEDTAYGILFGIAFGILGLIASLVLITKSLKKRVSLVHGARDYERPGSFKLLDRKDIFLYRRVYKTRRSDSSSSSRSRRR